MRRSKKSKDEEGAQPEKANKLGWKSRKGYGPEVPMGVPPEYDWRMTGVAGHLITDRETVRAWYVLAPVAWEFASNDQREALITAQEHVLASLAGRSVHERVTAAQVPVASWAAGLDAATPNPVDRAAWGRYLQAAQLRMYGSGAQDAVTFWGVSVSGAAPFRAGWSRLRGRDVAVDAQSRLAVDVEQVDALMGSVARPATQRELEWLIARSRGLGLPAPILGPTAGNGELEIGDVVGLMTSVEVDPGPIGSRTIAVTAANSHCFTEPVTAHVAVLSMARMEDRHIPELSPPWLSTALQFGGVEISSHLQVVAGARAAKDVKRRIDLIHDQKSQFALVAPNAQPPGLDIAHQDALTMKHVMEEGFSHEASRIYGYVRLAVAGDTARECLARARALIEAFGEHRIELRLMRGTDGAAREFVPGEPVSSTAHLRHMPARTYAAAMPHISGRLGDRRGHLVGTVRAAAATPFCWDLHLGMEVDDRSGYTPLVSGLGGGKSYLIGLLAALETLSGVQCTVLDPSGPLARIAQWAPIASRSSVLNLLNAPEGTLSPYGLVPEPTMESVIAEPRVAAALAQATGEEWELAAQRALSAAQVIARMERDELGLDALRACLSDGLAQHPLTEVLLGRALRLVPSRRDAALAEVVEILADRNRFPEPHAQLLHEALTHLSDHPRARLFFGSGSVSAQHTDAGLLVLTLAGLDLPDPTQDRVAWSVTDRLAVAVMALAARHASMRLYGGAMSARKFVALDEAHRLQDWVSGRTFLARLERDSRKWNTRVIAASQDTVTATSAQAASTALMSDVIIGAIDEESQQRAALDLLGVRTGVGYERVLSTLRPPSRASKNHHNTNTNSEASEQPAAETSRDGNESREFVARIHGRVGRFSVDASVLAGLSDLLNTRPEQNSTHGSGLNLPPHLPGHGAGQVNGHTVAAVTGQVEVGREDTLRWIA